MRDYPTFPGVYRIGSASNVNLLDSANSSNIIGAGGTLGGGGGVVGGCGTKGQVGNFQDVVIVAPEDPGETINFHNNSLSYPAAATTEAARWTTRSPLDAGRCASINSYNASPIGVTATVSKYSPQQHQQHRNGYGSDLNTGSMDSNSFSSGPTPGSARRNPEKGSHLLWVVTPVAASISVAIVVAALAGPQWLFTEERVPNNSYTGFPVFDLENDEAFVTKYTKSSLWILCYTFQGMKSYNCVKIDCFPEEQYRPDPQDSTLAIPYTIVKSAPFFIVSGVFLLISFFVFLVAACTHQNSLYYFTSGILFIVSGLLMLIGLIAYISIFKAEIGSKLRPKSQLQPPPLKFTYGHSFFLYVFGFVSTEFVGVLNIFLFISLQQVGHQKTIPCLSFMNAQEKVKDMEATRLSRIHLQEPDDGVSRFICKKHLIPTNLGQTDDVRRYYFEKPAKCDIHSKDLARSLNELYTEPAPSFQFYELPQEFPLTRSVSTATEIYSNNVNSPRSPTMGSCSKTTTATTINNSTGIVDRNNKKNQTNNSKEHLNDICGLSRGILAKGRKSKDELFNEFCSRAGMRPKPKDIYYIEDTGDRDDEGAIFIVDNYASLTKNGRGSYAEPRQRNSNSNSSLRSSDKTYPKSLFEMDRFEVGVWNNCLDQDSIRDRRLRDENFSHSRTLPRNFMKRNFYANNLEHCHSGAVGARAGCNGRDLYNSRDVFRKSCDDINAFNAAQRKVSNNLSVQWPATIPTSPSTYSTKPMYRSTTSNFSEFHQVPKFSRGYALDEQRSDVFDTFDLDQIERERRKSHASLFELGYDIINGTAV